MNVILSLFNRSSSTIIEKKFAIKISIMQCIIFLWQRAQRCVCNCVIIVQCKLYNNMCPVCVVPRFGQTPPLISGTVELGGHWGSICPGLVCLSTCRWGLESSTTGLSASWQIGQNKSHFEHLRKEAAKREIAVRKIRVRKEKEKYQRVSWRVRVTYHIWWLIPASWCFPFVTESTRIYELLHSYKSWLWSFR